MKVLINIVKYILILILIISAIAIGIISTVSSTILNKNYVIEKLEETNFYARTYNLVESNFEKYIYQSGLEKSVLENICTEEKVKKDINIMLANIYGGTKQKIDTTEIADKLNQNIANTDVNINQYKKEIEKFVQIICDEYTDTLIHTEYEGKINEGYTKIVNIIEKVNKILIITCVIDLIIILIINNKRILENFQSLGIALLSTGTFELIAIKIIVSKVGIDGITVFNMAFSDAIVTIIKDILSKINTIAIIEIIVAIILIILYSISEMSKKESKRRKY